MPALCHAAVCNVRVVFGRRIVDPTGETIVLFTLSFFACFGGLFFLCLVVRSQFWDAGITYSVKRQHYLLVCLPNSPRVQRGGVASENLKCFVPRPYRNLEQFNSSWTE